ncbi:MAG: hypothetical protein ABI364_00335 [Caldimonas sp.]
MTAGQHIAQVGLLLVAAIAIFGGSLQRVLGQPKLILPFVIAVAHYSSAT